MTHTPGPWKIEKSWMYHEDEAPFPIYDVVYDEPACSLTDGVFGALEEREANARLIAAAPDLLEALEMMLPENWLPGDYTFASRAAALDAARAAIAKAKGEAK